jgi:hypothetical protein
MDPVRARGGEPASHGHRIVRVHLLAGEIALAEPDDPAVAEVDGRQNRER